MEKLTRRDEIKLQLTTLKMMADSRMVNLEDAKAVAVDLLTEYKTLLAEEDQ
jgi:hypothetical protein